MSSTVSIKDVAEAAGVSKSTVSRVINGMGKATRISPSTQERVRAVAGQLGYRTNLVAQNISLGKGISIDPRLPEQETPRNLTGFIGLVLSTTSSADALALIPSLDPVLSAAGYRLIVITVPVDPVADQARVTELLTAGIEGFLCCPTLYPAVLKTVAGTRPVIVLWAGAAKAVVSILNGESVEQEAPSKPVATQDPVVPPVEAPPPVVVPETTPPAMTPEPEPVVIEPPHTILPTPETIPETPETEPESPITSIDDTQK